MVNSRSPVFIFAGDDTYSKEAAIKDLQAAFFGNSSKELDYRSFRGDESSAAQILDHITTISLLSAKRFAIVEDFEKLKKEDLERIMVYLKKPLASACLVLKTNERLNLERFAEVKKNVNIQYFSCPKREEITTWVKKFLIGKGKSIDEDASMLLKEAYGDELLPLSQELEKLVAYVGERKKVSLNDVEEITGKGISASAFDLADAVAEGKVDESMKITESLISTGKKHYEIIGLLCWHFKRILKAKALQSKGESDSGIIGILNINRGYTAKFFGQVRRFSMVELKSRMEILLEADLNIKRARYDPVLALEFAIIKLCLG